MTASSSILWFDCETTGLEENHHSMISYGALMFPEDNIYAESVGISTIIRFTDEPERLHWSDFALKMHKDSGLFDKIKDGISLSEATQDLKDFIDQNWDRSKKLILAGNSIAFDRRFLRTDMPDVENLLHYRMIDVSGMIEAYERILHIVIPRPTPPHDPIGDLQASLTLMKSIFSYIPEQYCAVVPH